MIPVAHVGGMPVEETLATLAPAAGMLALLVGARLRQLAGSLRRRGAPPGR
ncbi:MAG TPA: hypothetical protein VGF25_10520 [Thermoleophilaceae bacterium]